MTDPIVSLRLIRERHFFYIRLLTVALMTVVCTTGGCLTFFDVPLAEDYKMLTGALIMLLAALLYKLPHLAYWLNRTWFAKDQQSLELMGNNWSLYKARITSFKQFP